MRTIAGRSFHAHVAGDPNSNGTGQYAPACYLGLSADATDPEDTDTTLPGEVTSGSLARTQAAFAYTEGASTYTLTRTAVADHSIEIRKVGVFNAATGGIMVHESLVAPAPMIDGDETVFSVVVTL